MISETLIVIQYSGRQRSESTAHAVAEVEELV